MIELEKGYIAQTSLEHRKNFGQFYTLDKIAEFMLKWVIQCNPSSVYDPAFGMGVFFDQLIKIKPSCSFIAREKDKNSFDFYSARRSNKKNLNLLNEDYFDVWGESYDAIICNPPYNRFQNFNNKGVVLGKLSKLIGEKLSGYTNIATAFLLKSIMELQEGGRLAYIMPLEFLNTGYGEQVKRKLLELGDIHQIIQITDESGAFEEVVTTVCIILFEKSKCLNHVRFSKMTSVKRMEIEECSTIEIVDLNPSSKWLPYFDNYANVVKPPKQFVPLSTYGTFKRGIATGANDFFVINKNDIELFGLTKNDYCLCISKSQQIQTSIFNKQNLNELLANNEKIFLFKPKIPLSTNAKNYIKLGERENYHTRFLTKNRKLWYVVENRDVAPILFGVFSRGEVKIVRNQTDCLNLTCFHGFVPNAGFDKYIDKLFLFLKSSVGLALINRNRRMYGNELQKFEPKDLSSILVPSPIMFDSLTDDFVKNEIKYVEINQSISEVAQDVFRSF